MYILLWVFVIHNFIRIRSFAKRTTLVVYSKICRLITTIPTRIFIVLHVFRMLLLRQQFGEKLPYKQLTYSAKWTYRVVITFAIGNLINMFLLTDHGLMISSCLFSFSLGECIFWTKNLHMSHLHAMTTKRSSRS